MKSVLICISLFLLSTISAKAQSLSDLELLVEDTDLEALDYKLNEIVVRGYDGSNPPPLRKQPTQRILWGYGTTAYILDYDTIIYFDIIVMDAVHRDENGNEIKRFNLKEGKYPSEFKTYFLEKCTKEERSNIYFENIFLRDKEGNYLKIENEQKFCPHCIY